MDKTIMDRILNEEKRRSKGYKTIVEFISTNPRRAAFMNAAAIAKEVGVSESTVVRFAASLGYDGFPEFHKELGVWVREQYEQAEEKTVDVSEMSTIQRVMLSDMQKINDTISSIDESSFNMAVDALLKAKHIYIMGLRNSEPVAHFLAFYMQMIRIGKDDVFVGIGFPRYSMRTLKAMEFANDRKATVIAITDNEHSPMKMYSSCNLFAASDSSTFIDSMVAPMSMINALLTAICIKRPVEIRKHLKMLEQTWDTYQVYLNDEIDFMGDDPVIKPDKTDV
ncbi:MAG: MurR/RpiR family transcriptional regulator [Lachnospiraceae bacterium]|nr:MurR/RpiR family transcriptional regulator [Lachnospiraceae bacterium]